MLQLKNEDHLEKLNKKHYYGETERGAGKTLIVKILKSVKLHDFLILIKVVNRSV
jgi:hypothetical protein